MTNALFDLDDPTSNNLTEPKLSAQRRMTLRKQAALERGQHPLSVLFGHLPLHKDAAPANDRTAAGLRCGSCAHRGPGFYGYPKCLIANGARISNSANSECRAWWPACHDYTPRRDA
ncbi:hypothetical protein EDD29_0130 [Actinocorallia herbida]|uniref:Uncharacterized protein n=1 Tax=Actinocorallia herbida TaxID=58109 RepID=A0A3N1CMV9_9ACTN|nr:hypothetical protein [Actinocorallia herbida]ROO82649.1 hypothetical protein EDD29_0130 [Actinocorallia herbida]